MRTALAVLLLTATRVAAQDTVRVEARLALIEVVLVQTSQRILVEGALLAPESTLHLPTEPVYRLLGITDTPTRLYVTVAALQSQWPTTRVVYVPLEQRVLIFDPLNALPATRRVNDAVALRTQRSFGALPVHAGPFASVAVDDSAHGVVDVGYSYKGRASVAGRVDDRGAGFWGVTIAPDSRLFLTYNDGADAPPLFSARVSAGPLWISATYGPEREPDAAAFVRVSNGVQLYASKQYGVVTINPSPLLTVQLAHQWESQRTAARVSAGPSWASPFAFPVTSLTARR
jgi:hypothetical protein